MFQLDPQSIAARVRAGGARPLGLGASIILGALGYTAVSVAGFVPWAVFGKALRQAVGELGMYIACALVFIVLSGIVLHRLIAGTGALGRFYKVFTPAFFAYAVAWTVCWMKLRGPLGPDAAGALGLFIGALLMGLILTCAFDSISTLIPAVCAIFVFNAAGYFIGGWVEGAIMGPRDLTLLGLSRRGTMTLAMLLWGVFYGLGFGAGLGLAFYICQAKARALLNNSNA
jgi:hypothetical protein